MVIPEVTDGNEVVDGLLETIIFGLEDHVGVVQDAPVRSAFEAASHCALVESASLEWWTNERQK